MHVKAGDVLIADVDADNSRLSFSFKSKTGEPTEAGK
jgi:hypothetical protein